MPWPHFSLNIDKTLHSLKTDFSAVLGKPQVTAGCQESLTEVTNERRNDGLWFCVMALPLILSMHRAQEEQSPGLGAAFTLISYGKWAGYSHLLMVSHKHLNLWCLQILDLAKAEALAWVRQSL